MPIREIKLKSYKEQIFELFSEGAQPLRSSIQGWLEPPSPHVVGAYVLHQVDPKSRPKPMGEGGGRVHPKQLADVLKIMGVLYCSQLPEILSEIVGNFIFLAPLLGEGLIRPGPK